MAWERRVTSSQGMEVYDSGTAHQPIALVHVFELDRNRLHLNDLIQPWHFGVGMVAACLQSSGPKVFFVDRYIDSTRLLGHFAHIDHDEIFHVPVFEDTGLLVRWQAHRVVAIVAHLGPSMNGHYRAAIRVGPEGTWRVCDDNIAPCLVESLPDWVHARGVLWWTVPIEEMPTDAALLHHCLLLHRRLRPWHPHPPHHPQAIP